MTRPAATATRRDLLRGALAAGALLATTRGGAAASGGVGAPWRGVRPSTADDPYRWLENPDDPAVVAYLDAENAHTDAVLGRTGTLRDDLYNELLARVMQDDTSFPVAWRGWEYYRRYTSGQTYAVLCRRPAGEADPAKEQVLIDLNRVDSEFAALGGWTPNPDNTLLAYEIDLTGSEFWTTVLLDMATGQEVGRIERALDATWANDGQSLLYARLDDQRITRAVARHVLGSDPATDSVIYEEPDPTFSVGLGKTADQTWIVFSAGSFDTSETWAVPADATDAAPRLLAPRRPGIRTGIEHLGGEWLLLTNDGAQNFRLVAAPEADPAPAAWREIVPGRDDRLLEGFQPFAKGTTVSGRENGFTQVWTCDLATGALTPVPFAEAVYTVGFAPTLDFASPVFHVRYESFVTPPTTYRVDFATGERTTVKETKVFGDYDPAAYVSERLTATSADGTEVPISLVRRKDARPGPGPFRLHGYGGYGSSQDPVFSVQRLTLVDRGVGFAMAHIRGGMEFGERWWDEGRLQEKRHCFEDFIACAEQLVAEERTTPAQLAITGASNGGLLVAACATERPDLFGAVHAGVPVVDVIGFLLRSPIGPANWDELGDPNDPAVAAYVRSYSPYDNVRADGYPAMMVTAGFEDTRVPYWNPAKWVARIRDAGGDRRPLIFRTQFAAGHGGASGTFSATRQTADMYAFVLAALGVGGASLDDAGLTPPRAAPDATPKATPVGG